MNLYVGNLSYDATDADLERAFSRHGTVRDARVMSDRATGEARGFGFVEMDDAAEAQNAIAALNGTDVKGRLITVNEARPRAAAPTGGKKRR